MKSPFIFVLFLVLCVVASPSAAQEGQSWSGTWEMHYRPWPNIESIHVILQIADPVEDMLYPAKLTLTHGQFNGVYELLLVKKNDQQLDTGENYIAFFADNYGALPPNTANFILGTTDDEAGLYSFNFSAPANAYGTVMVARFQYAAFMF